MVYTALQLISRGRAAGLSIVDLGGKTGYDQKSCWYLVQQLLELGLVVKLRRAGVGANFCVHKHFFEREQVWQEIRGETAADVGDEEEGAEDDDVEVGAAADVKFDEIDARHLSSLELVKARIVKLLKASEGFIHPSQNLILKIVLLKSYICLLAVLMDRAGFSRAEEGRAEVLPDSSPRAY
jgi:hypothetical protein